MEPVVLFSVNKCKSEMSCADVVWWCDVSGGDGNCGGGSGGDYDGGGGD